MMDRTHNIPGRNPNFAYLASCFFTRIGHHTSVVIATVLLSPAFFSCQRAALPPGMEESPVQIYILRSKKTTPGGLDLFFFHDDALMLLDSYQHIEDGGEAHVQGIAGGSAHRLVAFSNLPASSFQWSDIRSAPALNSVSFSLENDSPVAPFLYGQCPLEEGRSRSCVLRLKTALCEIELHSLSCDFRGKAYEGAPFLLERVFLTWANSLCQPLSEETLLSYLNPGYLDETPRFRYPEMLCRSIGQEVGAARTTLETCLYCYPNPVTAAEMGRMPTHLVLEGSLDGHRCYYPIPLPALSADTHYAIDLTLTRLGSPEPDIPVESGTFILETDTQKWNHAEDLLVRF